VPQDSEIFEGEDLWPVGDLRIPAIVITQFAHRDQAFRPS
jgi:hypothetical protein